MLVDPNLNSPANIDAAVNMKNDYDGWKKKALSLQLGWCKCGWSDIALRHKFVSWDSKTSSSRVQAFKSLHDMSMNCMSIIHEIIKWVFLGLRLHSHALTQKSDSTSAPIALHMAQVRQLTRKSVEGWAASRKSMKRCVRRRFSAATAGLHE